MNDETLIRRAIVFLPSTEDREEANCAFDRILAEKAQAEKERDEERESFMKLCEELRIPATAGAYLEARRITALVHTLRRALGPFTKETIELSSDDLQYLRYPFRSGEFRRARVAVEAADKEIGK